MHRSFPSLYYAFVCCLGYLLVNLQCGNAQQVLVDPLAGSITQESRVPIDTLRPQLAGRRVQQPLANPQVQQAYELSNQAQHPSQAITYKDRRTSVLTGPDSSNVRVGDSTGPQIPVKDVCEPSPCVLVTSLCERDSAAALGYKCNAAGPSEEGGDQPNSSQSPTVMTTVRATKVNDVVASTTPAAEEVLTAAPAASASVAVTTAATVKATDSGCAPVTCSFDADMCKYKSTSWKWTKTKRLLNKLTGIRGDHSGSSAGGYAYLLGNTTDNAELASVPFTTAQNSQLSFWRHTAGHSGILSVCLEGQPGTQPCIWSRDQSKNLTAADRSWQQEKVQIPQGSNRIRFVASQLGGDNYVVGIDDVKLMTGDNTSSMATCTMAAGN